MEKYTKEYFIEKFEAIPDELWHKGSLTHPKNKECHCALGHLGVKHLEQLNDEAECLSKLLSPIQQNLVRWSDGTMWGKVSDINDGIDKTIELGKNPKERILNALKSLP